MPVRQRTQPEIEQILKTALMTRKLAGDDDLCRASVVEHPCSSNAATAIKDQTKSAAGNWSTIPCRNGSGLAAKWVSKSPKMVMFRSRPSGVTASSLGVSKACLS